MSEPHTDHSLPCWACFVDSQRNLSSRCRQRHHKECTGWDRPRGLDAWQCECECHEFAWPAAIKQLKIFSGGF